MEAIRSSCVFLLLLAVLVSGTTLANGAAYSYRCRNATRCSGKAITCPDECPYAYSKDPKAKVCQINCHSPKCEAECKHRKANCDGYGSACYDPRFIGADGVVFYFHGKSNEHFSLVSDRNLQINARFIGHRPAGRTRDFTWIQALGVLFGSHSFSVEAAKAAKWDDETDHLSFSYDGQEISLPEDALAVWNSPENSVKVERVSSKNSAVISIPGVAEIAVNAVPVTKEGDKVHNYQIPSDDCFSHLEVQFRFYSLSSKVEGVLGRTYQPDFENPAKPGVAMPVVGGEDKYRTSSLLSRECNFCIFSPAEAAEKESSLIMEPLDCTGKFAGGNGIVCKK